MLLDDVERVVDVAVVRAGDERTEVLPALLHRGRLGRRFEKPPVDEESDDSREIVADPRRELDAREELVEAERPEDGIENAGGHAPRLAKALRVTLLERDRDLALRGAVDVGFERLDEGLAGLERFAQASEVVRLPVVVARHRPEAQHDLAALDDPFSDFLQPKRRRQPEVCDAVVDHPLDCHFRSFFNGYVDR